MSTPLGGSRGWCVPGHGRLVGRVGPAGFVLAVLLLLAAAAPAQAQGVRGWARSSLRYVEIRPLRSVTVPFEELEPGSDGELTYRGMPVSCTPGGPCLLFLPGEVESATVGTQDVGFTAWGLGPEGLSFTGLFRGRADMGGDFTWPRSDDAFDALLGYAQYQRDGWRVRLGRQETLSGLGFAGYDGADVVFSPLDVLTVEAYGGRSLARGLNEPRHEALRGLESFIPDQNAWLLGGHARFSPTSGSDVSLRYQREIWNDRSGLISERASLDFRTDALRPVVVDGSADWDVAFDRIGKASLEVRLPLPSRGMVLGLEGRRYLPYFELSTIWGFFSPVAYHEILGRASWAGGPLVLWGTGGWRTYDATDAPLIIDPVEDDGWRAEAGGSYRAADDLSVEAGYRMEWGVGAFLSSGDVTLRYRPVERVSVALQGTAFQRIEEFRVGDGRVYGGGFLVDALLREGLRFDGGVAVYRNDSGRGGPDDVWNQVRAWTGIRLDFGSDPLRRATGGLRR